MLQWYIFQVIGSNQFIISNYSWPLLTNCVKSIYIMLCACTSMCFLSIIFCWNYLKCNEYIVIQHATLQLQTKTTKYNNNWRNSFWSRSPVSSFMFLICIMTPSILITYYQSKKWQAENIYKAIRCSSSCSRIFA